MAFDGESLVNIDPCDHICGIFAKYGIVVKEGNKFDWYQLIDKVIQTSELNHLVGSIGFLYDRSSYEVLDRHINRQTIKFKCIKCQTFNLQFIRQENGDRTNHDEVIIDPYSIFVHCPSCESKDTKPKRSVYQYLKESQLLINLVKRQQFVKPNKSSVNHELIISGLCLGKGVVTHKTINRVIASLKKIVNWYSHYYLMLVKYLQVYHDKNPSSSVVVQADQNNRFYRVFVSIPSSALVFKTLCIPFYFIDGTFHKTANYDGVLIQLCGKHGFGGSLRLCSAWVPTESAAHFAFFVLTMKNSGFDIENVPFMSDRGHLLAAGRLLNTVCGITISVKYCMEHIIRNTIGKFHIKKSAIPLLRKVISAMQGSDTFEKYLCNSHLLAE